MAKIAFTKAKKLVGYELNTIAAAKLIPALEIDKSRIGSKATTIYDPNGEPLFFRAPIFKGRGQFGYTDVAADESFGEPLLSTTHGAVWNEAAIRKQAIAHARRRRRNLRFDKIRFVAYSYPKIGIQFLSGREEVLMLEWGTWVEVPRMRVRVRDRNPMEPGNFERWSLLDEMPNTVKNRNIRSFKKRNEIWKEVRSARAFRKFDPIRIRPDLFPAPKPIKLVQSKELHFSTDANSHHPCYELIPQFTNVWCVAASCQMFLQFWRYEYTQDRIAQALGLGTRANPNGLPYSRVADVVTEIESFTSNALNATMVTNPGFNIFRNEINANRPLISFVPGHSRTVAGYAAFTFSLVDKLPFKGLLVYDPWLPNTGTIHRYENFRTQTYQFAYHANLTLI